MPAESAIAQTDWYSQIGAPPTQRTWPVVALVDNDGNITGLAAAGVAINIEGALEAIAAGSGLFNLTGGSAVPSAATYDQIVAALKAVRFGTADPVGNDGEAVIRLDLGGLLRTKSAGAWANVDPVTKTGEQLYDGTWPAASHTNEAVLVSTWGVWTLNEWFWSDGTQWWPVNRVLRLVDVTPSAAISPTVDTLVQTDTFPAGMLRGAALMNILGELVYVGTAGTKDPIVRFGASGAGTGGTSLFNNAAGATTVLHALLQKSVLITSNSQQYAVGAGSTSSSPWTTGSGVRTSMTVDLTAACEVSYSCTLSVGTDTVAAGLRYYEIHYPSRKT